MTRSRNILLFYLDRKIRASFLRCTNVDDKYLKLNIYIYISEINNIINMSKNNFYFRQIIVILNERIIVQEIASQVAVLKLSYVYRRYHQRTR